MHVYDTACFFFNLLLLFFHLSPPLSVLFPPFSLLLLLLSFAHGYDIKCLHAWGYYVLAHGMSSTSLLFLSLSALVLGLLEPCPFRPDSTHLKKGLSQSPLCLYPRSDANCSYHPCMWLLVICLYSHILVDGNYIEYKFVIQDQARL